MPGGRIEVANGREVRQAFKDLDSETGKAGSKALKRAHKETATKGAELARAGARAGSPLQQRMASAIKGAATAKGARLNITKAGGNGAAWAAFWGQKKRSGWFGASQYSDYDAQDQKLPKWVGSAWRAGVAGEGPHEINEALAEGRDEIEQVYLEAVHRAATEVGLV